MKNIYTLKNLAKLSAKALMSLALVFAVNSNANAQVTAAQSGNWSATSTWVGGVVPVSTDNVVVGGTFTVTVDGVDDCTTLTLGDGVSNGSIVFNAGDSLNLTGALTIGNATSTGSIDMTSGGILTLASYTAPTPGTWTPGLGTVTYILTAPITTYTFPNTFFTSYNNLNIKAVASSTIQTNLGISVTNSLNLISGTFDMNGFNLTVGDIQGAGSITNSGVAATLTTGGDNASTTLSGVIAGPIALVENGSGTLTLSGANTFTGGATLNSGQFNLNNGTALGTGVFTINAGAIDNTSGGNVTLTNNNIQIWNGSFTFDGTGGLNLGTGAVTFGNDVTITLFGTTPLTVGGVINDNVNSLYTNGTGSLDFSGQAIQINNFGIISGNIYTTAASLSIAGNFTNNGSFNDGLGSETFNGTSPQNVHGTKVCSFYNMTLNNSTGLYLNKTVNITNQLALLSGQVVLGADSLIIGSNGSITSASGTNYIVTGSTGTLSKIFTGAASFSYPVGDNLGATDYSPIDINVLSGSFPATVSVYTSPTKAPDNNSSVNYLDRYWNVSQSGLGVFSASITAYYLSTDVAGTEASIASAIWSGSFPWIKSTAVNTGAHRINETVSSFGEVSGITLAAPTVSITPTTVCLTANEVTAVTTGDDPSITYLWSTGGSTSAINPTISGTYTVTAVDGNGFIATQSQAITVNSPVVGLSSPVGTDGQTVCVNNPILDINYAIGGGSSGASVSTLPAGVTSSFSSGTLTITGTPTLGGVYTYTVTTTGSSCSPEATASGTIVVSAPSISLSSVAGTDAQSACLNNALTNITYAIDGSATTATVAGLPTGINYSFNSGVITISGTPTVSGVSTYTVSTSGGSCGTTTATGSISVGSLSLALTSGVGTDAQTVCYTSTIADITYAAGGSATSATVTGLPNGVNGAFSGGTVTISGKPAVGGVYTYTVTAIGGECAPEAIGTITVNQPTVSLITQAGTDNQLICQSSPIVTIKYLINTTATGATVSGLPTGVNYLYNNDTLVISGIPSDSGTFDYSVFTTGSPCGVGTATGIIQISAPFANLSSSFGTDAQAVCAGTTITNITYDIGGLATGATVSGLPTGVAFAYNTGLVTISGTPTLGGTYSYTVTTTGGLCNPATASGNIIVNAPILTLVSAPSTNNQSVCANTAISNIVYVYGGTTIGTSISGLPTGLSTASINDTLVISGTPTDTGSFTYTINTIGTSCSSIMVTGTITINTPQLSLSSGVNTDNQTICGKSQMANITYDLTGGATGASVTGLPSGVNFSYISGTLTISGLPSGSGAFPYTVTTNGGSCGSAMANGSISVNVTPTVTIQGVAGLRAGTNDTLVASGATSYVWLNNGVLSDSNIVVPVANTIYTVVGKDVDGCTDTSKFFVTINTVGIHELSTATTISLYPNPVLDVLNLSFDVVGLERSATVKVIDITGKEIVSSQTSISNGKTISFDVSTLAQGMYFVKVITPNNSQVLKFMKQ